MVVQERRMDAGELTPHRRGMLAVVALLVMVALSCGGSSEGPAGPEQRDGNTEITAVSAGEATPGGTLAYGLGAETSGWDATTAQWGGSGYAVAQAIFDRLMAYDENGEVVPYLAASMEPNDDYTTWTIGLRDDVVFHDGSPFDAAALEANLRAHLASPLTGPTMAAVENVRVDGRSTVLIELSEPWSTFPHLLSAQPGYMMAPAMMDNPDGSLEPVGTGPFRFVRWTQDSKLEVEKNPDYWREGFPLLDAIEFRVITDNAARTAALTTDEVQMAEITEANQILEVTADGEAGDLQVFVDREGETTETFMALNVTEPPFDDPVARRAVVSALDTQVISDTVFAGLFPPARGIFKPGSPWYVETDYPTHDPDLARSLAAEYEAAHGEPIAFSANITGQPEIQAIAQLVQSQLEAVGIEGQLNTLEQTQLIVDALGGNYQATGFILFGSSHPDRDYVFLHESTATGGIALGVHQERQLHDVGCNGRGSDHRRPRGADRAVRHRPGRDGRGPRHRLSRPQRQCPRRPQRGTGHPHLDHARRRGRQPQRGNPAFPLPGVAGRMTAQPA